MVLSRCFNEADPDLKCSTCHDPHANIAATRTHYDKICLGCHRMVVHKRSAVCPVAKDNCVSCHMPKGRVMVHSEFTRPLDTCNARRLNHRDKRFAKIITSGSQMHDSFGLVGCNLLVDKSGGA